mmetsp:Transcript_22545/g.89531  ORF Transcript_22545/g.89531 Transcript_22545/m.89531 type:complete len:507 (+) Transcript_22545:195-1715(+)
MHHPRPGPSQRRSPRRMAVRQARRPSRWKQNRLTPVGKAHSRQRDDSSQEHPLFSSATKCGPQLVRCCYFGGWDRSQPGRPRPSIAIETSAAHDLPGRRSHEARGRVGEARGGSGPHVRGRRDVERVVRDHARVDALIVAAFGEIVEIVVVVERGAPEHEVVVVVVEVVVEVVGVHGRGLVVVVRDDEAYGLAPAQFGRAEAVERLRVATVDEAVLVVRRAVDDLELLDVDEDAARARLAALVVVLARREDGEDGGHLGERHAVGVGLVGAHDERTARLLEEVVDRLLAEAHGAAAAQRLAEPGRVEPGLLVLHRGVRPHAFGGHLVQRRGALALGVGRVDRHGFRDEVEQVEPIERLGLRAEERRRAMRRHDRRAARRVDVRRGAAAEARARRGRDAPRREDRVGRPSRDAAVHAKDVVVDDGRERQPVEGRVDGVPDVPAARVAEAVLALPQERPVAVVFLPAVDVARLVVAAQQPDLLGLDGFDGEQVRDDLERAEPAIDVVP